MASPVPIAPLGSGSWNSRPVQQPQHNHQSQQQQQQQLQQQQQYMPSVAEVDEHGIQSRPMGLKVHYTFDKESKVNCLARHQQTLQVQTIPIDDSTSIGVVDLRACIHAVTECSPELVGQESDYTIYAMDFSEPDTPLVGQGMLSWALDSMRTDSMLQQPKMVTGRVTKNLLGVFGGGNRETLEVRLRLSVTPRTNRHARHNSVDMQQSRPLESAMTPTGTTEWNSFIQSNPQIGQIGNVSRVASPALSQGHGQPPMVSRRDSFGPQYQPNMPTQDGQMQRVAPVLVDPSEQHIEGPAPSSRPSSRASNRAPRRKQPTGRPRGRPRKKPLEGNTSGYEDGTEGEDGPAKKRVKTATVDRAAPNPFAASTESLRVAASTSGSLRNFRPVLAANNDGAAGSSNHLQEVPRAPTPVPEGPLRGPPGRNAALINPRRESALSQQPLSNNSVFAETRQPLSPSQEDGRSPESIAPTPTYSEDSPVDIGSSPPVQRATPFMRSSPPPSSPVLPPMPPAIFPRDACFATDEMDGLFGDEPPQEPHQIAQSMRPIRIAPKPPVHNARIPSEARNSSGVPIQVFQMQDGPAGQDLVHICSYNTPQPTVQASAPSDSQSLPPLKKPPVRMPSNRKSKPASPPLMAPTPPPTTDAPEKPVSPPFTAEQAPDATAHQHLVPGEASQDTAAHTASAPSALSAPTHAGDLSDAKTIRSSNKAQILTTQPPRQLSRSQSAGVLALPTIPASEPAGPSTLSQSFEAEVEWPAPPAPSVLKRAASTGPLPLPVPASDPIVPIATPSSMTQAEPYIAKSDAVPPPSSPQFPLSGAAARANKNIVKKHAIKQRLEEAIMNGEMPPYCSNCGAIETPTWRKIWVQDKEGIPEYCEYSEKPGRVTAIEILQRDTDDKPTLHRLIKKSLGPDDDRDKWQQLLLCNPCGIWLTKCKSHRPQDRWDKDASRLGQDRKKRSRSKKARGKGDELVNPTSEAYLPTDALDPVEPSSPKQPGGGLLEGQYSRDDGAPEVSASFGMQETQSNPGSTHSRATGTAKSPVDVEFDEAVGNTKRLLFPSPRKDGALKTLGELDVNIVQTPDNDGCQPKGCGEGKENTLTATQDGECNNDVDDLDALFKTPSTARSSTPPPNATPREPFKTPTRSTPSHRPITRSISRSIRSIRSIASPNQQVLQQALSQRTPTKTRQVSFGNPGSVGRRRSPRNHQGDFEVFDTPISRTISQMFSDGAGFGDNDLDLSNLPSLDGDHGGLIDFGSLLSTDAVMPSSPPKDGSMSFDYHGSSSAWAAWDLDTASMDANEV